MSKYGIQILNQSRQFLQGTDFVKARSFQPRSWIKISNPPGWARQEIVGDDLIDPKYKGLDKGVIKEHV